MKPSRSHWRPLIALAAAFAACVALEPVQAQFSLGGGALGGCDPSIATCQGGGASFGGIGSGSSGGTGAGGGVGGMCQANPNGNPNCGGSGPASIGGSSGGVQVGGGNPINLVSGNKYQEEVDLAPLPGVLGLELERHYNSRSSHAGLLGTNWRISYETVLYDFGAELQIVQADGRRLVFQRGVHGNAMLCASTDMQDGQVRIEEHDGQRRYHWRWPDGRTLSFAAGSGGGYPLQSIAAATGERLSLTYAPSGELVQVRDPQSRTLRFIYEGRRLRAIDTPLGRLRYTQDKLGRLTEVAQAMDASNAPTVTRIYHYEDRYNGGHATALTGISIKGVDPTTAKPIEQRLSTYVYNQEGLAVLSTKGRPKEFQGGRPVAETGIEQIEVDYVTKPLPSDGHVTKYGEWKPSQVGRTIVTNSLGVKTEVLSAIIAGQLRLIEMHGPGCGTCGPSNMRYAWDANGRLLAATRLDDRGRPIASELRRYDAHGRLTRVGAQAHLAGRPQLPRWSERYEYTDTRYANGDIALAPLPSVIARQSVVANKEHTTSIDYNALWQPERITERGYSPIDGNGNPSLQGTPIERSTTYSYKRINGRSVLTEIDGPLPNGPKGAPEDSDITRIEWDEAANFVSAATGPGNARERLERDELGRVVTVTLPDGATETLRYEPRGAPRSVERQAGSTLVDRTSYRYDALGRVVEVLRFDGYQDRPSELRGFDIAGRLAWQADAVGILRSASYDGESHLLASRVAGAGNVQEERYSYDTQGRLQRVQDAAGTRREFVRDDGGRLVAAIDPLGRWTYYESEPNGLRVTQAANTRQPLVVRYELDERGHLRAVSAQASDGLRAARRVTHALWNDDFGRVVALLNPDSGREVRSYDADDRLVKVLQPDGSTVEFEHDVAGRLLRRAATPKPGTPDLPQTVRYTYVGSRLQRIDDPEQSERYDYDAQGRVAARTVALRLNDGSEATSVTRYRYDERGLLAARTLPDGSELRYERNGQGRIVALQRQAAPWAPFGWGRSTLATDLQRDLVGLSRITYGNGVAGHWQRSREGLLARVIYSAPRSGASAVRTAFERLMPEAEAAQAAAPAASALGALALPVEPRALWDNRLLFDAAGNILLQRQAAPNAPAQTLYAYDAHDQLAQALRSDETGSRNVGAASTTLTWRYHHDSLGNRLLAQQMQPSAEMSGTTKVQYEDSSDREAQRRLDDAGRTLQDATRSYRWDALGRLASVTRDGKTTAYRYNRLGLRVAKRGELAQHYLYDEQRHRAAELDSKGRITREYVWLDDQLIAVIDTPPRAIEQRGDGVLERIAATLNMLWVSITGDSPAIAYVHVDHLGAPVAMTDVNARTVWRAEYAPFGRRIDPNTTQALRTAAPVPAPRPDIDGHRLDLRLPGQWEDEESGLHYNDQRYYDPEAGRYISSDPLGLAGGLNGYAYVGNNPLGYGDPRGLVLFAFDGTGNTNDDAWLRSHQSSLSNVSQFFGLYEDGNRRYITGVGTLHRDEQYGDIRPEDYSQGTLLGRMPGVSLEDADMGGNYSGPARIDRMIQYFNDETDLFEDDNAGMDVDIVGFSRGAAEARDFANFIVGHTRNGYYSYTGANGTQHCQKVDFRFMGLFDTVLSTDRTHHVYNLAITDQFAYVAQAVALNEYRGDTHHAGFSSWGAFPLESIMQHEATPQPQPQAGRTRIERGFMGAHADIGGGFGPNDSQLAQVALTWMVDQARAAGVRMQEAPSTIVANPVVHDRSDNIAWGQPGPYSEDRQVHYGDGTSTTQRRMAFSAGMSYPDTLQFIDYFDRDSAQWSHQGENWQTGTVDMRGYLDWLNNNGYDIHLAVQ